MYAVVALMLHVKFSRAAEHCRADDVEGVESFRRGMFLVCDGPSCVGSKELSAAWFGSDGKLVVNAQDDASPKVRLVQTGRFTCNRFEKKLWQFVATREALCQGSLWSVELSHPQRNIH